MVSIKRIETILGKSISGNARKKFIISSELAALKQAENLLRKELTELEADHSALLDAVDDLTRR